MNQQDRHSAIADFQLIVVQEVLGRLPVTDADFQQTEDVCVDCAECARALARTAFRWDSQKDQGYEDAVCDAVALYSLTVSAVRWNLCPLSADDKEAPGRFLAEMIRRTSDSSFIVKTLVNELRLAPFRGPELTRAVNFVKDGKVDFAAWRQDTADPVFVETVEAIFRHG